MILFKNSARILNVFASCVLVCQKSMPVISGLLTLIVINALSLCVSISAQTKTDTEVLTDSALTKIVPSSFYFAGQSAGTQMRNAAAARLDKDRYIIAALVDT